MVNHIWTQLEMKYVKDQIFLAQAALCAPPEVALQCVAGHCYYQLSVFSPSLLLLRLLLLTHFGETPEAENLFPPIFWHN